MPRSVPRPGAPEGCPGQGGGTAARRASGSAHRRVCSHGSVHLALAAASRVNVQSCFRAVKRIHK